MSFAFSGYADNGLEEIGVRYFVSIVAGNSMLVQAAGSYSAFPKTRRYSMNPALSDVPSLQNNRLSLICELPRLIQSLPLRLDRHGTVSATDGH